MIDEHTDPGKARKALEESQAAKVRTDSVISEAAELFGLIRAHRQQNHYADKLRTIMRGAH